MAWAQTARRPGGTSRRGAPCARVVLPGYMGMLAVGVNVRVRYSRSSA